MMQTRHVASLRDAKGERSEFKIQNSKFKIKDTHKSI